MIFLFCTPMNPIWEKGIQEMRNDFPDHQFVFTESMEERETILQQADGIVIGNLTMDSLIRAENLKILFVPWAGLDRLPLNLLNDKKCLLANTHGNAKNVAERAFGLCLSLLGKIVSYDKDLRKGIWHGYSVHSPEKDKWTSLSKQKIGIIGYGTIGRCLIKLLEPFECDLTGLKKSLPVNQPTEPITLVKTLEEIIEKSDILFLFLPLTKTTQGLISQKILQKMKGKYLINMGRGSLIDEEPLYHSLQKGELAGLAMDVWFQYPNKEIKNIYPSRYPFHELPNVVLSPHVGGFCHEGQKEMIMETFQNIKSFILTGKPLYLANTKEGY